MLSLDPSPSLAVFSGRRHGISAGLPASPLRRGKRLSISPHRPFDERARVTELFLEKKLPKMDATSKIFDPSPSIILTCGRSGNISMLLSLRLLKSFILLLNAFLLRFLFPSRPQKQSFPVEKPKEEKQETGGCKTGRRVQAGIFWQRNISPGFNSDQGTMKRRALAIRRVAQDGDGSSVRDFSFFVTPRGDTLFTQSWTPGSIKVRGLVVLLHGLNEHSSRYDNFSRQLNANGYKVYGMDWIGHGGSDGLHAYVHSLDDAVGDMKAFLEKVLGENPELPCFFFGHSTGAAIVLKAVLDPKVESVVKGMVLTSPAIRVQPSHPIIGLLAPLFSLLLPKYQFSAANKPGLPVSRDPEALAAKYSDPLVYTGSIRVRTGSEILRITSYLQQNLTKVTVPFLVLHGTLDTVTDPEASQKLYEEASSTDKSIKLYEGLLHDLLFEPEREAIAQDIIDWLNSKLK